MTTQSNPEPTAEVTESTETPQSPESKPRFNRKIVAIAAAATAVVVTAIVVRVKKSNDNELLPVDEDQVTEEEILEKLNKS